jgi:hypothetical protein
MPQTAGKPVKKSSKTKSKSSSTSTSKRHFTVVIGTKEHGLYCSSSPSSAARKAVSNLCGKKVKNVEFCLREITQGSKKKTYGPYLGHVEKLAKPIQLKGRLVERMPVARLKPKSSAKKGGMRGGDEIPIINMNNINKEYIIKVKKDINNGKNFKNILNKYKNKYNSDVIDDIIAHKIVDDIYEKRDNMNHYHSVLRKYKNKGFNSQINSAERIMRFSRSLY